jgi:signal peptidase I
LRTVVELFVALVIAALVARTWLAQGFVVSSGSMAETLRGPHRQARCPRCEYCFAVGAAHEDQLPSLGAVAICPNCGGNCPLDDLPDLPGDRLLVAKEAFGLRHPRRWELAVFRDPRDAASAAIKRVVGLPGESIRIRGGNVYANGRLLRKTLAEQRRLMLPVYDATHAGDAPCWQGAASPSGWRSASGRFRYSPAQPSAQAAASLDWLQYLHWRDRRRDKSSRPDDHSTNGMVRDTYGYNQGVPLVALHVCHELFLSFRFQFAGTGQLFIEAASAGHQFRVVLDFGNHRALLLADDKVTARARLDPRECSIHQAEVSTIDEQFLCAIDGNQLFPARTFVPGKDTTSGPAFRIAARDMAVTLDRLRIYRDIYYTHPRAGPRWACDRPCRLGRAEYFVLGDNSPLSQDSRWWASPAVPESHFIGKPILIYREPARTERAERSNHGSWSRW